MKLLWHKFQTFLLQKDNIKNSVKGEHPIKGFPNTWAKCAVGNLKNSAIQLQEVFDPIMSYLKPILDVDQ